MAIIDVGLTHKAVPLDLLERLLWPSSEIPQLLLKLHAIPGVREALVLSTCNRIEAYFDAADPPARLRRSFAAALASRAGVLANEVEGLLTCGDEAHAVNHLLSVLCGLDSMAVGEDQIVAQFRSSVRLAVGARTLGPVLSRLADAALTTSKRVRTETEIGRRGISLAHAGLALSIGHLGTLTGRTALVIGAGAMGSLAARLLSEHGTGQILVASRTEASAKRVAGTVSGSVVPLTAVSGVLGDCDVVISAVGAADPVLPVGILRTARRFCAGRPLFLLDLAMPRDIDPACGHLPGVALVDIEILGRRLAAQRISDDLRDAHRIIAQEAEAFLVRRQQAMAIPVIGAMRTRVQEVVDTELLWLDGRLADLDDRDRTLVSTAMQRAINKLMHGPTVRVKELSASPGGAVYVEALSRLFDLHGSEAEI